MRWGAMAGRTPCSAVLSGRFVQTVLVPLLTVVSLLTAIGLSPAAAQQTVAGLVKASQGLTSVEEVARVLV